MAKSRWVGWQRLASRGQTRGWTPTSGTRYWYDGGRAGDSERFVENLAGYRYDLE